MQEGVEEKHSRQEPQATPPPPQPPPLPAPSHAVEEEQGIIREEQRGGDGMEEQAPPPPESSMPADGGSLRRGHAEELSTKKLGLYFRRQSCRQSKMEGDGSVRVIRRRRVRGVKEAQGRERVVGFGERDPASPQAPPRSIMTSDYVDQ